MTSTRGYAQRVDVRADIDTVWHALIDPATMAQWYSPGARIDAREGGSYYVRHIDEVDREAHIDVFLPPTRLRLIYMPMPGLSDEGAVIVEDFLLNRDAAAARSAGVKAVTVLRLMGSGVPESSDWNAMYMTLRRGWERGLMRLKVLLERPPERPGPQFRPLTGL
jgi:uncharacterized protein YndB with AHSA1/START domain